MAKSANLIPIKAAAKAAGVSLRTIQRWEIDGLQGVHLRTHVRGGRVLVDLADVQQFNERVQAQRIKRIQAARTPRATKARLKIVLQQVEAKHGLKAKKD